MLCLVLRIEYDSENDLAGFISKTNSVVLTFGSLPSIKILFSKLVAAFSTDDYFVLMDLATSTS